jgi:hypothetical protein
MQNDSNLAVLSPFVQVAIAERVVAMPFQHLPFGVEAVVEALDEVWDTAVAWELEFSGAERVAFQIL